MDLITPGFGLVFWTAVTFIFLLVILRKFAWNPILGAVSDREEGIKAALASAEEARKEMENLTADNDRILKEARSERQAMLKEARELKSNMIETAKEEAKEEANKLVLQAQAAIAAEKKGSYCRFKISSCKAFNFYCRNSCSRRAVRQIKTRKISGINAGKCKTKLINNDRNKSSY